MKAYVKENEVSKCISNNNFYPVVDCGEYNPVTITYGLKSKKEAQEVVDFVNTIYDNPDVIREDGIFYISNTYNEYDSRIIAYFRAFSDALDALKECHDWYSNYNTGTIGFRKYGLHYDDYTLFRKSH